MRIRPGDLTIILPTKNASHNIRRFLKSATEDIHLIVVDASEDSTPDIVSSLRPDYTNLIRHLGTVTESRRRGANAAKNPWLLFTDADIVFSAAYFRNIAKLEEYYLIYGPKLSWTAFVPIINGLLTFSVSFIHSGYLLFRVQIALSNGGL